MSNQPEFIISLWPGRREHYDQKDALPVHYAPTYRKLKPMGGIPCSAQIGYDKTRLEWHTSHAHHTAPKTAEGVKSVVRRIRDEEAELLDVLDAEIADLRAKLRAAQNERKELLKRAFDKGHVVRLSEAVEVAEAKMAASTSVPA